MFEPAHPFGRPPRPFVSKNVLACVAREPWQVEAYLRLRRDIFSAEQGLFSGSDLDEHDAMATPIVALSHTFGMQDEVVGVVRIYPHGGGTWYGGRLGVRASHRRVGAVGSALIRTAVSTAHARCCRLFLATVQRENVRYFERHHFVRQEEVTVCGRPHQLMQADLSKYPACPREALARGRAA